MSSVRSVLMLTCFSLSAACSSPDISYRPLREPPGDDEHAPKTTSAVDPAAGEYVFALRRSSILFPAPAVKKTDETVAGTFKIVCPAPAGKANSEPSWKSCLWGTAPVVVPQPSPPDLYVMRPMGGISLQTAYSDADPLLLTSVSVNYKNPTTEGISRVGGEAATGFALAGVPGAITVTLVSEVINHVQKTYNLVTPAWNLDVDLLPLPDQGITRLNQLKTRLRASKSLVCSDDSDLPSKDVAASLQLPADTQQSMLLPVELKRSLPVASNCWRQFPRGDEPFTNKGWFYRTVDPANPSGGAGDFPPLYNAVTDRGHLPAAFRLPAQVNDKPAVFAVSACHSVVLQVAWWEDLAGQADTPLPATEKLAWAKSYSLAVADPSVLQTLTIDKSARKISLLACGAYAVQGVSTTTDDSAANAFFKQAKTVRDAQKAWDKDHQ